MFEENEHQQLQSDLLTVCSSMRCSGERNQDDNLKNMNIQEHRGSSLQAVLSLQEVLWSVVMKRFKERAVFWSSHNFISFICQILSHVFFIFVVDLGRWSSAWRSPPSGCSRVTNGVLEDFVGVLQNTISWPRRCSDVCLFVCCRDDDDDDDYIILSEHSQLSWKRSICQIAAAPTLVLQERSSPTSKSDDWRLHLVTSRLHHTDSDLC